MGVDTVVDQHLLQLPGNLIRVNISVIDIIGNTEQTDDPVIRDLVNMKSCLNVIETVLRPTGGIESIEITDLTAIQANLVQNSADFLLLKGSKDINEI